MMTYFCKYTPVEMLAAFHAELREPNAAVMDFAKAEEIIHSSVCSHAKMLVMSYLQEKEKGEKQEMILTNCCDSIRRVYDILPGDDFSFRKMLDLPHSNADYAVQMYARSLSDLRRSLSEYYGSEFDRDAFLAYWRKNASAFSEFMDSDDPCIAVMGARTSDELFQKIRGTFQTMPSVPDSRSAGGRQGNDGKTDPSGIDVINFTCGGLRSLSQPPEDAETMEDDALMRAYAKALLMQIPCMRMEDISGRTRLLRKKGLRAIVYHSVRFCDYYSAEYAQICRHSDLPVLKIESDYTLQSEGQLSTRLQAFAESLQAKAKESTGAAPIAERSASSRRADVTGKIYMGIDSGSTTTNVVVIDETGRLLSWSTVRTGAKAGLSARKACDEVRAKLGDAGRSIEKIVATGYGRSNISIADESVTEISCHARGAHFADPKARCIIDIGGQDSKVICLDDDGNVANFVMNDKCAAGTGRFLEMMAHTLEMDLDAMGSAGLNWKREITITSTCTVFAESEVVSYVAENVDTADIVHALDVSVASKTVSMVHRVHGTGPYMMTGGVAKNTGVAREIERRLEASLAIMPHPDLIGALGAALFARG